MKKMKFLISSVLIICLVISSLALATEEVSNVPPSGDVATNVEVVVPNDVVKGSWYEEFVIEALSKKFVSVNASGDYLPNSFATVQESLDGLVEVLNAHPELKPTSGDAVASGDIIESGDKAVSGDAIVSGDKAVSGDAIVSGDKEVSGDAIVESGDKVVSGDVIESGDKVVSGDKEVVELVESGDKAVSGDAVVSGDKEVAETVKSGDKAVSGDKVKEDEKVEKKSSNPLANEEVAEEDLSEEDEMLAELFEEFQNYLNKDITREELAYYVYEVAEYFGKGFKGVWAFNLSFEDKKDIDADCYEAVCWCYLNGIMIGNGNNQLRPDAPATRAELATVLVRLDKAL